jgi:hypothetical protein
MHQPDPTSEEAHRERMKRGVTAVQTYLHAQFPEYIIEILRENSDDIARCRRTFNVRTNGHRHLLQVSDEVLDLDIEGVSGLLRTFQVARTLREEGAGKVVVIMTHGIRIELI